MATKLKKVKTLKLYPWGGRRRRRGRLLLHHYRYLQHFVLEEGMLEVDCPCVTPEVVLKASGHVDKFTDLMVKDEKTGNCYRADHLLKDLCKEKLEKDNTLPPEKVEEFNKILAILDDLSAEQLGAKIKEYGIVAPDTKNSLSDPYPFNLMFQTSIGPSGLSPGYMRPETAQEDKSHPKFGDVSNLEFLMFPREKQMTGKSAIKLKLGEAVSKGTVNNETLGYFIGRVYLFLTQLGIDKDRLRFRQHLPNEMAHYAADCWDAEIECSYGWIECVGIADRSAYDLRAHSKLIITPSKKEIGLAFKGNQKMVLQALEALSKTEALDMKAALESKGEVDFRVCTLGKDVTIKKSMVSISLEKKKEHGRKFTPSVIEPSFGIGRIIYCLFEHCYYQRPGKTEDEQLNVFGFPPLVAPIKCTVFPLVKIEKFDIVAKKISKALTAAGISHIVDITGTSIGKRYARTDEIGVPLAITVDSTTSVTVRDRDSKDQVRVEVDEVASVVKEVMDGQSTWADIMWRYPAHTAAATDEE
ncbi:hypothetical protein PR202_gb15823 [Eleusine coracana subsp. coracana]|uniref:Anticodon-binding domain-containing protein n=1 Tax=Eleusine coracana subsp. coracana TaxID=191504 RepID=A0AAV5EZB3_ELECO|nr:hypothetical protein PR202_gb15823 [Eleusine coracana subsp. coracana]